MKTPPAAALESFAIEPIGVVEAPFDSVRGGSDYERESRVILRPEFLPGLVGIEYFSHLWVIYRQHRSQEWLEARNWPAGAPLVLPAEDDRAGQGVFSSRAPCRPARLGSCIVGLLGREDNVLRVKGLDAVDGTPVVDLKPYVPAFDAFPEAVVPLHWAKVMDRPCDGDSISRTMHWDTSNVDFALGLRAGIVLLRLLGLGRGDPCVARLEGSAFLAHGFEMATGCSPLRSSLAWVAVAPGKPWTCRMTAGGLSVSLRLTNRDWASTSEVLDASEERLWVPVVEVAAGEGPEKSGRPPQGGAPSA